MGLKEFKLPCEDCLPNWGNATPLTLEDEAKTEVKVVEVANKSVKKFPSESLKNYKSGDIVVSKNDGNKYKVVMYKNQKKWKLIEE